MYFGPPHLQPHDSSMTCSEYNPLSSAHQIQKEIKLVTQDKFEKHLHCHAIFDHSCPFWSIFVHFMGNPTATLY